MQPGRATGSNPVLPQSHSQQRPNGGFFASISAKDLSGGTPLQRTIISTYGHTSPEVVTQASDIAVLVRPASDEGRPKECRHARVHGQSCRRILQTGGQIARRWVSSQSIH